jgi:hypothetical protein
VVYLQKAVDAGSKHIGIVNSYYSHLFTQKSLFSRKSPICFTKLAKSGNTCRGGVAVKITVYGTETKADVCNDHCATPSEAGF